LAEVGEGEGAIPAARGLYEGEDLMSAVADCSLFDHYPAALSVARSRFPSLSAQDHEDIVAEAIARVWARQRIGPLEDERSYLLRVVSRCGARVLERRRPTVSFDADSNGEMRDLEAQADRSLAPLSVEERVLDRAEAAQVRRIIDEQLKPDEGRALMLRAAHGMAPDEVARFMGCSPRKYRKLLERAGRKLAVGLVHARDEEALVLYAAGVTRGRELERARALARTPRGAEILAAIRARMQGAAALLPVPAAATGNEAGEQGLVERILQAIRNFFEALLEAIRSVVVAVHGRLVGLDVSGPSQALTGGGVRGPGAAVAIAIACGGGTYCAVEGLPDPLSKLGRDLIGRQESRRPTKADRAAKKPRETPALPIEGRALIVTRLPAAAARKPRAEPAGRADDDARAANEFGIESAAATTPRAPAPPAATSSAGRAQACEFGVDGC
jgi:RNA polymerase sigma factor (sigma-70 family)